MNDVSIDANNGPNGSKIQIDPEDIIAVSGALLAIVILVGMFVGRLPVNVMTGGLAGLSACGAVIAKVLQARRLSPKS
jgi:hypothetical protein